MVLPEKNVFEKKRWVRIFVVRKTQMALWGGIQTDTCIQVTASNVQAHVIHICLCCWSSGKAQERQTSPDALGSTCRTNGHSTLLYSIVPYCIPLYSTAFYSTVLYSALLYTTLPYTTLFYLQNYWGCSTDKN